MGDNNAVIVQIVAVIAILFFCFITYMNTKNWRWPHVLFNFLAFAAALTYMVYAAQVMKTRAAWQKEVTKLEQEVKKQQAELNMYLYGDQTPQKEDRVRSVYEYQQETNRVVLDRGDVWRNCSLVESAITSETTPVSEVKVTLNTVPPNTLDGAKIEPNGLREDKILYAFRDFSNNGPLRYVYVGEFRVTAATETSVSLVTTIPLDKVEQGFVAGNQPWVLHAIMPIDSMEGLKRSDTTVVWDQIITRDTFPDDASYQAALQEYKHDGEKATDEDPPENVYAKVKFKKSHTFEVDSPEELSPAGEGSESNFFDKNGQAQFPLLRRGKPVTFEEGQEAEIIYAGARDEQGMLKEKGAKELEEEGVVTILDRVYRRKLNDYAFEFRSIWLRRIELQEKSRELNYESEQLDQEYAISQNNEKMLNERITKMIADGRQVVLEKQKITAYTANVKAALDKAKKEFVDLVRQIDQKHEQILAANKRLAARSMTNAVPASVSP
jgi:hypothetical protein